MAPKDTADRGRLLTIEPQAAGDGQDVRLVAGGRLGCGKLAAPMLSLWIQVRGTGWLESREGRFRLRRGDWMVLERDSAPLVQSDAHGMFVGACLGDQAIAEFETLTGDACLYVGRGRVTRPMLRTLVRLWREARRAGDDAALAIRPLLLQFAVVQRELAQRVRRCPGRSNSRKQQVFGRMQRARLYLEGNSHRIVRVSELADMTSFSSWYFSKAFQSLYDETAQSVAVRARLDRAAELLRASPMMIGEVASACGFDNCCSFARAFRVQFGMTASRYRTLNRAAGEGARGVPRRPATAAARG